MTDIPSPLFISTMKNEGPYILEWLAYHRVIGFSKFLIFTNDCEDGTTDILDRLMSLGLVQHEENVVLRRGPHKSALKHAKEHPLALAAEWIYVADIDEYLNIHLGDGTVQDLIAAHPEADAIPITWRLFSHNGLVELERSDLLEDFTDAERALDNGGQMRRFVKTLFRNDHRVERFGLHTPIIGDAFESEFCWVAPNGRTLDAEDNKSRPEREFGYDGAQVNHYAVRTLDGYLVKRDRGRANHFRQTLGSDYWRRMCRGGEEDRSIQRHVPAVREEMARILQDKTLADMHASSLEWHNAKVAELREIEDFEALRVELLALSDAGDHHRAEDVSTDAQAVLTLEELISGSSSEATADANLGNQAHDSKALIRALRLSIQDIEPLERHLAAAQLINKLETVYNSRDQ